MKFVVKRDFYRTKQLKNVKIVGAVEGASKTPPHPNHIHMGALIELGDSENESELRTGSKDDPAMKQLIAGLRVSAAIGDAADPDVMQKVKEHVLSANRRQESESRLVENASMNSAVSKLTELFSGLLAKQKA